MITARDWTLTSVIFPLQRGEVPLIAWFSFLLLIPFYTGRSGKPQPADILVLLLAVAVLGNTRTGIDRLVRVKVVQRLRAFVLYVAAISLAWSVADLSVGFSKKAFLMQPAFYLFNAIVFSTALALFFRYRRYFLTVTIGGAVASLTLQAILSVFYAGGSVREILFFNNPNQLAYYALLFATIVAIGAVQLEMPPLLSATGLLGAGWLSLLANSKAGVVSILVLAALLTIRRLKTAIGVALVVLVVASTTNLLESPYEKVYNRITGREADDKLSTGRGYDRIVNHPQYCIFGAAEGRYDRFDSELPGELHSTPGTIFFAYGIVGTLIFIRFLYSVVEGASFRLVPLLVPIGLYGITHNGLRARSFWVFLAVLYGARCLHLHASAQLAAAAQSRQRALSEVAGRRSRVALTQG